MDNPVIISEEAKIFTVDGRSAHPRVYRCRISEGQVTMFDGQLVLFVALQKSCQKGLASDAHGSKGTVRERADSQTQIAPFHLPARPCHAHRGLRNMFDPTQRF